MKFFFQNDLENDLLRIMYESKVPLLENEELFITLQTSQRTSLEVKEALVTSEVTEKEIDSARQVKFGVIWKIFRINIDTTTSLLLFDLWAILDII